VIYWRGEATKNVQICGCADSQMVVDMRKRRRKRVFLPSAQ